MPSAAEILGVGNSKPSNAPKKLGTENSKSSCAAENLGMGNSKASYASKPSYNTKPDAYSLVAQISTYQGSNKKSKDSTAANSLFANNEVKSAAKSQKQSRENAGQGSPKTSKNSYSLFAKNVVKTTSKSQKPSGQNAIGLWGTN